MRVHRVFRCKLFPGKLWVFETDSKYFQYSIQASEVALGEFPTDEFRQSITG